MAFRCPSYFFLSMVSFGATLLFPKSYSLIVVRDFLSSSTVAILKHSVFKFLVVPTALIWIMLANIEGKVLLVQRTYNVRMCDNGNTTSQTHSLPPSRHMPPFVFHNCTRLFLNQCLCLSVCVCVGEAHALFRAALLFEPSRKIMTLFFLINAQHYLLYKSF